MLLHPVLRTRTRTLAFALVAVSLSATVTVAEDGFVDLFDGQSIEGWVKRGGEATYAVEADAEGGTQVVGTSVMDTPNTFLCTGRDYADFVLEFEVKVDTGLNSGVQFRSQCFDEPTVFEIKKSDGSMSKKNIPAGRVHGYQCEIDTSPRAWSGGIYDEARRGWLYDLDGDKRAAARSAFNLEGWNKYRIEATGDHISTSINGIRVAHLHDNVTPSGFIALQVHGIPSAELAGKQIRWRNIRIKEVTE